MTRPSSDIVIRPIDFNRDSVTELTELLHRAYKRLGDMGLRFWATWQTEDITLERATSGKCYVAVQDGHFIATITYYYPIRHQDTPWYSQPGVATFGQFAVEPRLQQQGIGARLIELVEEAAKSEGATEMALSTAEPATHLIRYYERRGYRFIETAAFSQTDYRSVIMSKTLVSSRETPTPI
jgi:GNAT superfamily N-acetyltransferase